MGGVFADMLSRDLAKAILDHPGWLKFKAAAYFFKADHNAAGVVDKPKARRVNSRLAAELGVKQIGDGHFLYLLQQHSDSTWDGARHAAQEVPAGDFAVPNTASRDSDGVGALAVDENA